MSKLKYWQDLPDLNSLQNSYCLSRPSLTCCLIAPVPVASLLHICPFWQGPCHAVSAEVIWASPWQTWLCTLVVLEVCLEALCPLPLLPLPGKCKLARGGRGGGQRVFSFSLLLVICVSPLRVQDALPWCVLCQLAAGLLAAGTLELGPPASVMSSLWEMRRWCKSWSRGEVIHGKRNRILNYILANMVNFYFHWCPFCLYPVAGWVNA